MEYVLRHSSSFVPARSPLLPDGEAAPFSPEFALASRKIAPFQPEIALARPEILSIPMAPGRVQPPVSREAEAGFIARACIENNPLRFYGYAPFAVPSGGNSLRRNRPFICPSKTKAAQGRRN